MDTRKLGLIFLGISGFMIIIALMTFAIGGYNLENVDEEKINLTVKKYDYYSVFVTPEYSCKELELSIYRDDWEYFFEDCDAVFNEEGWNYVGSDFDGIMGIDSNS